MLNYVFQCPDSKSDSVRSWFTGSSKDIWILYRLITEIRLVSMQYWGQYIFFFGGGIEVLWSNGACDCATHHHYGLLYYTIILLLHRPLYWTFLWMSTFGCRHQSGLFLKQNAPVHVDIMDILTDWQVGIAGIARHLPLNSIFQGTLRHLDIINDNLCVV